MAAPVCRFVSSVLGALTVATMASFTIPVGCGGRSSLLIRDGEPAPEPEEPASDAFCAEASFRGGFGRLSTYILLDRSESMMNDGKWDKASAALSGFVQDPALEGLGVGLQLFPKGSTCDTDEYAVPAVPVAPLPGPVDAFQQVLASTALQLKGATPTLPVLRAGITHARALQLEDPSHAVIVAVVTDGAPNECESTTENLVAIAKDGAESSPQVLTFVIGIDLGYTEPLEKLAAAGGTGAPVLIEGAATAQELVDALRSFQDTLLECRYPLPVVGDEVQASDVNVTYRLTEDEGEVAVQRVAGAAACHAGAFYVEPATAPTDTVLCPGLCDELRQNDEAVVTVTVGCGDGSEPSPPDPGDPGDPGSCDGTTSVACVEQCGAGELEKPICVDGLWTCPAGTVSLQSCNDCPPIPFGCCQSDGSLAEGSCIDGEWACPPGAVPYGSAGCSPPDVCAATLLCPVGQYCDVHDFTCGTETTAGICLSSPESCTPTFEPVCGCNGLVYDNECVAHSVGVDISVTQACPTPSGMFDCGPRFCDVGVEICRQTVLLNEPGAPTTYACEPASPSCLNSCQTCAGVCAPCPSCTESCTESQGAVTVTCSVL